MQVSVNVPLTGTLDSYRTVDRLAVKTNFLSQQTIFFRVVLTSPQATLTSVSVESVKLIPLPVGSGDPDVLLYSLSGGNGTTPVGNVASFSIESQTATQADFRFTLQDSFLVGVLPDVGRAYRTSTVVRAMFEDVSGKRVVSTLNIDSALYSQLQGAENTIEAYPAALSGVTASAFVASLNTVTFLAALMIACVYVA
jgi:hypothetical protein